MDVRLIPVNAFIALVSPRATSWPNPLYEIGYRLEGLEVPANAGDGRVVIDCVAFDAEENRFMVAEGKSGNNIEDDQARLAVLRLLSAHDGPILRGRGLSEPVAHDLRRVGSGTDRKR